MSVDHMPPAVTGDQHLLDRASNSAEAAELRRDYAAVRRSLGLVPLFTIEVQAPRKAGAATLLSCSANPGSASHEQPAAGGRGQAQVPPD